MAFGLATFEFMVIDGTVQATNITVIGGETPGRQSVPRSELFGAIVLITRVHCNVCARLGIDAAYVNHGVHKRARLETGSNGDLWGLFFMILDLRTADLQIEKVASHIETQGTEAVSWGYPQFVDIIGNAMADATAELAVQLIRPEQNRGRAAAATDNAGVHLQWLYTVEALGLIWQRSHPRRAKRQTRRTVIRPGRS